MAEDLNKYSTALAFGELPTWINESDAQRLMSYKVYEDMFRVVPSSFSVMLRGVDEPILVPTAKGIINTLVRFVGRGFTVAIDPAYGSEQEQKDAAVLIDEFMRRERVKSKFKIAIREQLKYGDAFWYIHADTNKPEGARISLTTLDPGTVQLLTDPNDDRLLTGASVVEHVTVGDATLIRRQRWLKGTHPDHPAYNETVPAYDAPIVYDKMDLELDGWEGDDAVVVTKHVEDLELPVATLPIYHWRNAGDSDDLYGTSELQGLERVFAGINQAVSDEDMALSMAGLGLYKSAKGGPVDEDGNETDWILGPGRVVEDETFERVNGVSNIAPSLEHIRYLEEKADMISGVTDVARGGIETSVAESGIALSIKLGPTIDAAEEKDQEMREVFDNLLHDLRAWFGAVEGLNLENIRFNTVFGDKMPSNREAEIKELLSLVEAKIVSVQYAQQRLKEKYGYELPADVFDQIAQEATALATAADPYGDRLAQEGAGDEDPAAGPAEEPVT